MNGLSTPLSVGGETPKGQGEVKQELITLGIQIIELEKEVDRIKTRLISVIQDKPKEARPEEKEANIVCKLAGEIRGQRKRVGVQVRRIRDILEDLEI